MIFKKPNQTKQTNQKKKKTKQKKAGLSGVGDKKAPVCVLT